MTDGRFDVYLVDGDYVEPVIGRGIGITTPVTIIVRYGILNPYVKGVLTRS
jgi:hypothetical protein